MRDLEILTCLIEIVACRYDVVENYLIGAHKRVSEILHDIEERGKHAFHFSNHLVREWDAVPASNLAAVGDALEKVSYPFQVYREHDHQSANFRWFGKCTGQPLGEDFLDGMDFFAKFYGGLKGFIRRL